MYYLECNIAAKNVSNRSAAVYLVRSNHSSPYLFAPASAVIFRHQRENGYMSHAMPTLTSTNIANVHAAYLIRPAALRQPRHANAKDKKAANNSIAEKWLMFIAPALNQTLRPAAISQASNIATRFTRPAAAMKRDP